MLDKVDVLVIGGAMANTLLFAEGKDVGKSLCERDMAETARGILAKAKGKALVLPSDAIVAREFKANAPTETSRKDPGYCIWLRHDARTYRPYKRIACTR